MAGEDKQNVHIFVQGQIGIMRIVKPGVSKQSNNPQYQLSLQNPTFSVKPHQRNVTPQLESEALQKVQLRVKTSQEYPDPSIFMSLPLYNLNSNKQNRIHFWDVKTQHEFLPEADLASGQTVIAELDTYHSDSDLTQRFGNRSARLAAVFVQDKEQINYYTPQDIPEGFTPLSEEELNNNAPVPPQAPAPQFNNNTPTADPFNGNNQNNGNFNSFGGNTNQQGTEANPYGSGQNAQTMAPNSQWKQNNVTPSSSNPLLGGQNNGTQNTGIPNFNSGNQNANPAPTNNGAQNTGMPNFNAGNQNAGAAPTNSGTQNTGMPNFNSGNQNANPAPTNNGTQNAGMPNFNNGNQNAGATPNTNSNPQDPFAGAGDTIDISDDDLPF